MTETVKSSPDETKKDTTSSAKSSSRVLKQSNDGNDATKASEKPEKPLTKVVVRRLPPSMTLESFVDQVSPLPPVDYMYFVKADSSLAPNSFCRAYLHFIHVHDLLIFTEKFDNYVFLDNKGNEYPALVEYAPFQRIPRQRSSRKKDPRSGTIENDQYYQEFVEALKLEEAQRKAASKTNKQHFFETPTGITVQKDTTTPLLEYVKARRAEKLRLRDERERERRKKENEKRSSRVTARFSKTSEGEGDSDAVFVKPAPIPKDPLTIPSPDLAEIQTRYLRCMIGLDADTSGQVQGGGGASATDNKIQKDENKRPVKETTVRRREDDRPRIREKDRDRRDREKERDQRNEVRERGQRSDQRRDHRDHRDNRERELTGDTDKERDQDQEKDENRPKETRKVGKSYQEERQRLSERRLAAKNTNTKNENPPVADVTEKGTDKSANDVLSDGQDKTICIRKSTDAGPDSKLRTFDKYKSDQGRPLSNKENRKTERSNKYAKDSDTRQNNELKSDDRSQKTSQESLEKTDSKKGIIKNENRRSEKYTSDGPKPASEKIHRNIKHDQGAKFQLKEEMRKKSYNLEREHRRASDRKVPFKNDSVHVSKSEDKLKTSKDVVSSKSESSLDTKSVVENKPKDENEQNASGDHVVNERRHSLSVHDETEDIKEESSRRKSLSDPKTNPKGDSSPRKKTDKEAKTDGKDKKDPRAERRIRNKDRPSMEIYRPGMGRYSRQKLEHEKGRPKERDPPSSSPSPDSMKS